MGKSFKNSGEFLAEHAMAAEESDEQRGRVYNGNITETGNGGDNPAATATVRKRQSKRRLSVLNLLFILGLGSTIVLLYVYNAVRVGELLREIGDLESRSQKLLNTNQVLRAEINRKSTLERIGDIAHNELGLISPRRQPVWFSLDSTLARRAAEVRDAGLAHTAAETVASSGNRGEFSPKNGGAGSPERGGAGK